MQTLLKDQFVSQQDLDNAQVNFDAAGAAQESLQAQVNQMEVALAQAETNLAYSYIRAPFPGYIAERNLDTGAYVSSATASTSTMSRGIMKKRLVGGNQFIHYTCPRCVFQHTSRLGPKP